MTYCTACLAMLPAGADVCPECGIPLTREASGSHNANFTATIASTPGISYSGYDLTYGHSTAIHNGLNQDNTLAVIARDYNISLFVNGQFVDSVQDDTFTQGAIGVYAGTLIGTPTDVTFSNVSVWTL